MRDILVHNNKSEFLKPRFAAMRFTFYGQTSGSLMLTIERVWAGIQITSIACYTFTYRPKDATIR